MQMGAEPPIDTKIYDFRAKNFALGSSYPYYTKGIDANRKDQREDLDKSSVKTGGNSLPSTSSVGHRDIYRESNLWSYGQGRIVRIHKRNIPDDPMRSAVHLLLCKLWEFKFPPDDWIYGPSFEMTASWLGKVPVPTDRSKVPGAVAYYPTRT